MNQWIERYIGDVTRRLPEKNRDEVCLELRANIYDMLPENANDDAAKEVLNQLGPPAALAEQYQQGPRYLISPSFYGDYVHALKWIVPLVSVVLLVVGMIVGAIDSIKDEPAQLGAFIGSSLSSGISMGITGAFQALFWTTLGFVIAERAGYRSEQAGSKWRVEDLPEKQRPSGRGRIPLSDSIGEIIVSLVFCTVALLFVAGRLPFLVTISGSGASIYGFFSESFLTACVPAVIALALLTVAAGIIKIKDRRWTPLVCGATLADNLISAMIWLYMLGRPDMFTTNFLTYIKGFPWSDADILRLAEENGINPVLVIIGIVVVIITIANCVSAIYKTVKYARKR